MKDNFFWFKNNRIIIPGVTGEHLLMHISDMHLHVYDELCDEAEIQRAKQGEDSWMTGKENFARSGGEPFGDAQKISSVEAFEKILSLASELKPDALLLSGDNLDYMHSAGERYLRNRLEKYKQNVGTFICVPGNHESGTCEGVWESGIKVYELDKFRVVAVDNSKKTLKDQDILKLESVCKEGIPVIILCHIPLCTDMCRDKLEYAGEYFYVDSNSDDVNSRKLVSIAADNSTVKAVVCGHLHRYINCELAPQKRQIIGSQGMAGAVDLITVCGE